MHLPTGSAICKLAYGQLTCCARRYGQCVKLAYGQLSCCSGLRAVHEACPRAADRMRSPKGSASSLPTGSYIACLRAADALRLPTGSAASLPTGSPTSLLTIRMAGSKKNITDIYIYMSINCLYRNKYMYIYIYMCICIRHTHSTYMLYICF